MQPNTNKAVSAMFQLQQAIVAYHSKLSMYDNQEIELLASVKAAQFLLTQSSGIDREALVHCPARKSLVNSVISFPFVWQKTTRSLPPEVLGNAETLKCVPGRPAAPCTVKVWVRARLPNPALSVTPLAAKVTFTGPVAKLPSTK